MINKELKHVEDFHNAFGLGVAKKPTIDLSKETIKLRFNLMKEENEEYFEAANKRIKNKLTFKLNIFFN